MNIQEAKWEVIHTVQAYTAKDAEGNYRIPRIRQRPVLLMGPPGIGKTAVVEQAAEACNVGLVSYTITHHTRQSAVGLPLIEKKWYQGREISVTEYTMSEIIASVYDCMAQTGHQEGILFIDEVNCVSETLAPTMLQFLQAKTFGNHRVPDGWVIVAAGNPAEYNKSVREFDIVTLDRVKKLDVEADYPAWKSYAASHGIHGAIRSYLEGKPQCFYYLEQNPDGKAFVTARGWEDLSVILQAYEEMEVPVDTKLIAQYLQCEEIAGDFGAYYALYQSYGKRYGKDLAGILDGRDLEADLQCRPDEQLAVTNLLISHVLDHAAAWGKREKEAKRRQEVEELLLRQEEEEQLLGDVIEDFFGKRRRALDIRMQAGTIREDEIRLEQTVDRQISSRLREWQRAGLDWKAVRMELELTEKEEDDLREAEAAACGVRMERVLSWILKNFGEGAAFLAAMEIFSMNKECVAIVRRTSCPVYEEHCGDLMIHDRERQLKKQLEDLQKTSLFAKGE